jgi:hypothetical protein
MVLQKESAKEWHTPHIWFKSCPRCQTRLSAMRWVKDLDRHEEADLALQPRRRQQEPAALAA